MELKRKTKRFFAGNRAPLHTAFSKWQRWRERRNAQTIDEALAKRELIKIILLQIPIMTTDEVAEILEKTIHCQVVQINRHVARLI